MSWFWPAQGLLLQQPGRAVILHHLTSLPGLGKGVFLQLEKVAAVPTLQVPCGELLFAH